jgi:hypothetical protein
MKTDKELRLSYPEFTNPVARHSGPNPQETAGFGL